MPSRHVAVVAALMAAVTPPSTIRSEAAHQRSGRIYKHRNTVERRFNRLKHWRAIATRYDKYALTYLGGVTLAASVTYHRVHN